MSVASRLERVVAAAVRRPLLVAMTVAVVALAGAGAALVALSPSASTDTLVDEDSETFQATERYHERFGDDPVFVLVKGPLTTLLGTSDLQRLIALEGCISGNVPQGAEIPGGPNGPCGKLAKDRPIRVVYGPGTFLNEAQRQISDQFQGQLQGLQSRQQRAANAARQLARSKGRSKAQQDKLARQASELVQAEFFRELLTLSQRYGITSIPSISDPSFVFSVVFDASKGQGVPKERFAYLFPNKDSALIQVRLRPELSEDERTRTIEHIRDATQMSLFRTGEATYTVTGAPVVVSDLTDEISSSIFILLFGAMVVMAFVLAVVFRSRPRLLPLAVALAATGMVFGGMAAIGAPLTMASIAVLPVLIGLGVDYAIQLQSRWEEEMGRTGDAAEAARRAAVAGGPAIAAAALATAAGFLALLISPVPMVRSFGLLLVAGIALALACALSAGFAVLVTARRSRARGGGALGDAVAGAGEIVDGVGGAIARVRRRGPLWWTVLVLVAAAGLVVAGVLWTPVTLLLAAVSLVALRPFAEALGRVWRRALGTSATQPGRVLAIGAVVAALGFAADTQTDVVSDITKLVPNDLTALQDITDLQESTDVSGQIDVTVRSDDLTDPKVIEWMTSYQRELQARYGQGGCGEAKVCPALSLTSLFQTGPGQALTRERIQGLLDVVPPYFSQAVITADRKVATMAFGIKLMPLDEQQDVIEEMRSRLDPPPGVRAELAGLPVLAAEANDAVSSQGRRLLTLLAGLGLVALVLLLVFRRVERALVPLVPIALATGWSALVLFALQVPLNPMSVTLGALVVAIATEFSVLLSERYRQERIAGRSRNAALERTYRSTGEAVLASGATAIAGFAVLAFSDIRMLRDFGLVTVVDLAVALAGVMLVLPAVLVLAERRAEARPAAAEAMPRRRIRLRRRRAAAG